MVKNGEDIFDVIKKLYIKNNKINYFLLVLTLMTVVLFLFIAYDLQKCNQLFGYIITSFIQILFSLIILTAFVDISINKENDTKTGFAIIVNILFIFSPIMLLSNDYLDKIYVKIINTIFLIILFPLLYKNIKVTADHDFKYLKKGNFNISLFLAITVFAIKILSENEILINITSKIIPLIVYLDFYCFLQLIMLQGFYEKLEKKKILASN